MGFYFNFLSTCVSLCKFQTELVSILFLVVALPQALKTCYLTNNFDVNATASDKMCLSILEIISWSVILSSCIIIVRLIRFQLHKANPFHSNPLLILP